MTMTRQRSNGLSKETLLLIALLMVTYLPDALAKNKPAPKMPSAQELVDSAAGQLNAGYYQQAEVTLQGIDIKDPALNFGQYYTLLGIAQTGTKHHQAALDSFKLAFKHGQQESSLFRFMAENHFALKEYPATLETLKQAKVNFKDYPNLLEMKTQAHWALEQKPAAWEAIGLARQLFPDRTKYLKQQIAYALELSLFQQATELAKLYLINPVSKAEELVTIGNALRINKQLPQASDFLEAARLRFPEHAQIAKVLAHTYIDRGMSLTAANILEQASRLHPEFISEASELHKNAGNLNHALFLNAQIADQPKKLKQRLAIFLAMKQYESVISLEDSLNRYRLMGDESIRYAIAYAAFSAGEFERAKKHLAFVREPGLFKQATELQRIMQECTDKQGACS